MNFKEGFVVVGHDPEPLQIAVLREGCLVNMSLPGTPDFVPEGIIVGLNRLGDPIDDVLDRPKADVKVENRVAELLNAGPAVAVISGQIADQRRSAWDQIRCCVLDRSSALFSAPHSGQTAE